MPAIMEPCSCLLLSAENFPKSKVRLCIFSLEPQYSSFFFFGLRFTLVSIKQSLYLYFYCPLRLSDKGIFISVGNYKMISLFSVIQEQRQRVLLKKLTCE